MHLLHCFIPVLNPNYSIFVFVCPILELSQPWNTLLAIFLSTILSIDSCLTM